MKLSAPLPMTDAAEKEGKLLHTKRDTLASGQQEQLLRVCMPVNLCRRLAKVLISCVRACTDTRT